MLDDRGTPVSKARIELIPLELESRRFFRFELHQWTNVRGEYAMNGVAPGQYLVSIHKHAAPTNEVPLVGVFYPGVDDEDAAERISIYADNTTPLLPVKLRRLDTTTVLVNVMFEDGTRPARSNLSFHNPQFPHQAVIGNEAPEVEGGRGSFTLPVGFEYIARAAVRCDAGSRIETRESRPIQHVDIVQQLTPLELTFVIAGDACRLWELD